MPNCPFCGRPNEMLQESSESCPCTKNEKSLGFFRSIISYAEDDDPNLGIVLHNFIDVIPQRTCREAALEVAASAGLAHCSVYKLERFLKVKRPDFTAFDPFFVFGITDEKMIKILLKNKGIVDFEFLGDYSILLRYACKHKNLSLATLLVTYGADVNIPFRHHTHLSYLMKYKYTEVTDLLLLCGANPFPNEDSVLNKRPLELVLHHVANLNSTVEIEWTPLSEAVFNGDMELTKQLIEDGDSIDALALYSAVVGENFDMFHLVWTTIDAGVATSAIRVMNFVFERWINLDELDKVKLLLSREDVDLHLYRYGRLCVKYITTLLQQYGNTILTDDFLELVNNFGRRGLRLTAPHLLHGVIPLVDGSFERRNLIKMFLSATLPPITDQILLTSFLYNLSDLIVPYCFDLTVDSFYSLLSKCNGRNLHRFLRFCAQIFTISRRNKERLIYIFRRTVHQCENEINQIPDGVPSLLELSRDAVRRSFRNRITTTRQYIETLDNLELPEVLKDIIRYKIPTH